jgi:glycosyltransferase involved in cell wall biosynthesis
MYVIVGHYIDDRIKNERKLPSHNPAGSNRMVRLGMAIRSLGNKVVILSPGSSMRMAWTGKYFHNHSISKANGIPIVYCSAIGLPYVSIIWELLNIPLYLYKLHKKSRLMGVMVYCYYPSSLIAALFARYILGVDVVEDLEDICIPKLSDWSHQSEVRPVQQIYGWVAMKIVMNISKSIIIPSHNFQEYVNNNKRIEVITGCMKVADRNLTKIAIEERIKVLFAGAFTRENGINLLVEMLKILNNDIEIARRYQFHICGYGANENWIRKKIDRLDNVIVTMHGFVSSDEYNKLVEKSNICLVLQDPYGRFSDYKTPSKGYEFIGYGKAIIVANIGGFSNLPDNVRILLDPYTSERLAGILHEITIADIQLISEAAYNYARDNWTLNKVGKKIQDLF